MLPPTLFTWDPIGCPYGKGDTKLLLHDLKSQKYHAVDNKVDSYVSNLTRH